MTSYLIIFLLFLLQFVYAPVGTSFFEGSKVYVVEIVVFLLVLLGLFSKKGFSFHRYNKRMLGSLGVLFFISLYHIFFSHSPTILFGNAFRLQGTILLWFLMLFALVSGNFSVEKKVNKVFIASIIGMQFICTILFIGVGADRPVGTLGEPNALSATVIFLWPFLFFPKPRKRFEWLLVISSLLLVLLIIFVTGSRSGLIAFGIQLAFVIGVYVLKKSLRWSTGFALILVVLSFITPFLSKGDLYENRGEVWVSALHAGLAAPLLGVGFGNAEYALHKSNVALHNHLPGYYIDSSHNIFLDWFVQGGIVGLGVFLFLLHKTISIFIKQEKILYLVLLLGLLAALSFNPASVVSLIALWWLIGQGIFLPVESRENI